MPVLARRKLSKYCEELRHHRFRGNQQESPIDKSPFASARFKWIDVEIKNFGYADRGERFAPGFKTVLTSASQ
jgi:hypothetical protein